MNRRALLVLLVVVLIVVLVIGWPGTIGGQSRGRVTVYTQCCITASGAHVDLGVVSCSYRWPLYSHVTIWSQDETQTFEGTCLDRGDLDRYNVSLDVWLEPWMIPQWLAVFGDYPRFEVVVP